MKFKGADFIEITTTKGTTFKIKEKYTDDKTIEKCLFGLIDYYIENNKNEADLMSVLKCS